MKKFNFSSFIKDLYSTTKQQSSIKKKTIVSSLVKLYGLGIYHSKYVIKIFGLHPHTAVYSSNVNVYKPIFLYFKKNLNLKIFSLKLDNVKYLKYIKNYKGFRHIYSLPVRGQRSRTNAKTRKKNNII